MESALNGKKEKIAALVLAAGSGTRFGSDTPKQFLMLDEMPMFLYSVDALLPYVDRLIVVTREDLTGETERVLEDAGVLSEVEVIAGGNERYESSIKGLQALETGPSCDYVLIHDSARCMLTGEIVKRVIDGVKKDGAVIAAIPSKDTMKLVSGDGEVLSTPDRKGCFAVQTPQAFRTAIIREAYEKAAEADALSLLTDDASAVERFTETKVTVVPGSEENFKVTTPFDFMMAEAVLTARRLKKEAES